MGAAAAAAAVAAVVFWIGDGGGIFRFAGAPGESGGGASAGAGFPRTFSDFHGLPVTLAKAPRRIASQSLPTDHLLFAVVPAERIAAVSAYADRPQYSNVAALVRRRGIPSMRDAEQAIRLRPDLLLASNISRADFADLVRGAGIPTYVMRTVFRSLDEIEGGLRRIGDLSGERQAADAAVAEFRAAAAAAAAMRPAGGRHDPPRVLALTGFSYSSGAGSYGAGSLFADIMEKLGAVNVGSEQGLGEWGKVGREQIAAWNPDWIVAGAGGDDPAEAAARLAADPAVAVTAAGRKGRILVVEDRYYLATSQHVVHLMRAVAEALYGSE